MLATLAARTMSPHDASLSSAAAAVFAAEPGPGIQVDHGGPWWAGNVRSNHPTRNWSLLEGFEVTIRLKGDRACSLSFQTLVRTRSQQWFLESLRRFYKPFIIFHHNLYCSLLVSTQTCKTGHGGILFPCNRNTLLRRQKRRSPWWRAPGSRLCQVAPVELNFHKRYQEMVRSKGPKWSNIQQRQQRQHPPIPCALRAQFSVAERYLGFVTVTLSWRCVLIDLQGKPWLNWLSQLHAIPILNLLIFEKTLQWTIQWLYSMYLLTILHMIFTAKPSQASGMPSTLTAGATWHHGIRGWIPKPAPTCTSRDSRAPKIELRADFFDNLDQIWRIPPVPCGSI